MIDENLDKKFICETLCFLYSLKKSSTKIIASFYLWSLLIPFIAAFSKSEK